MCVHHRRHPVDDARHVILPRIGRLRTAEATTKLLCRVTAGSARILRATVSREADRWFVSFTCMVERNSLVDNAREDIVGVDLGVATLVALSTGELVPGARPLRWAQRRLRRLQRTVSRRRKGSMRRRSAVARLARAHRRVANVRRHHLHVLTTGLAKKHGCLVIEDLNVRGMSRSARGTGDRPGRHVRAKAGQNRAVLDGGFAALRRMLETIAPGTAAGSSSATAGSPAASAAPAAAHFAGSCPAASAPSAVMAVGCTWTATSTRPAISSGGRRPTQVRPVRPEPGVRALPTPVESPSDPARPGTATMKREPGPSRSPPARLEAVIGEDSLLSTDDERRT